MKNSEITATSNRASNILADAPAVPVMLVAFAPVDAVTVDRCLVAASFTIGRASLSDLPIRDDKVSKTHLRITRDNQGFWIEDLGSTNGTFVNGDPIAPKQKHALTSHAIIRVGRAVLVFHSNGKSMLEPSPGQQFGMAGRFHAGPLLQELREAALSGRHILLAGPTGTGKELSANALSSMHGKDGKPLHLVVHNAARFTSDEEAASTLFGVGPRVFSNVDARPGVIELAHGGALFLDEVHNLPERVQRSLLRVIEDGLLSRIGETSQRKAHVRFIFASNAEPPTYALAHDLIARLRVVQIPPLAERTADIPNIFKTVLRAKLKEHGISNPEIFSLFGGDHYEAMCLDGFKTNNVRGLVDLADRVATKVVSGKDPMQAILEVFGERFSGGSVVKRHMKDSTTPESNNSYYEKNKGIIVAIYLECDGNVSKTVDSLQSQGIRCSRRWITVFVEKWGLKKKK